MEVAEKKEKKGKKMAGKSRGKPTGKPTGKSTGKPAGKSMRKSAAKSTGKSAGKSARKSPRNYELAPGLMRFSRSRMYKKRNLYKKIGDQKKRNTAKSTKRVERMKVKGLAKREAKKLRMEKAKAKKDETAGAQVSKKAAKKSQKQRRTKTRSLSTEPVKRPLAVVTKSIGGEKNGGKRVVPVRRAPGYYPTSCPPRKLPNNKKPFSKHKRSLRPSITPGTVLILVAGPHRGKRVVFLKQLASGLLLITGPMAVNGCPMRRVNQIFVIATKKKISLKGLKLPGHINDKYFDREKKKAKAFNADNENIFEDQKVKYEVSEQRKADQKTVDAMLIAALKKTQEKKLVFDYLKTMFSLSRTDQPHLMAF